MTSRTKHILIALLVFLIFMALVIGIGYAISLHGSRFILFIAILGIVGAIACIASLIYLDRSQSALAGPEASASDAANLDTLVHAAEAKLKSVAGSLASLPLVYVLGDENSAKTQTVLQAGLDPELLAGAVFRDGLVAPTQSANIWYTQSAVIVEAGGALLKQPGLWQRLVRLTQPNKLATALKKGSLQPTRAAVLCVSAESLQAAAAAPDGIRTLGQTFNARLRVLSQTLGISLPVYILFTKLDTISSFGDFAANLSDAEARSTVGALLAHQSAGTGLYAEWAAADVAARFDELRYSLSEFRLELLSRGGAPEKLAHAYEFPRELRKLRQPIVDLVIETGRPSQLGVSPFLRGFYFSGIRARIVEDAPARQGAEPAAPAAPVGDPSATRIFSFKSAAAPAQQMPARSTARRVPEWVFLPHLFPRVILADRSALESSRASTKVNTVKRVLIGAAGCCLLLYLVALTGSFVNNSALEDRLAAAAALPVGPAPADGSNAAASLQNLDQVRQVFAQIAEYHMKRTPLSYRWGLFGGDALYNRACAVYGDRFRTALLHPTQRKIVTALAALPSTPKDTDEYTATYNPLKAYLITTSNPEKSTTDFLPGALETAWLQGQQPASTVASLAAQQFETYAATLGEPNSCMASLGGETDGPSVQRARAYLAQFQGFEHVYLSMKAAANRKFPPIVFNNLYQGSERYVIDKYSVDGAFTRGGYDFMQNAIAHPDPYASGEDWVLGPQAAHAIDRASLDRQLPDRYKTDFINAWRTYLKSAHVVPASSLPDAKERLHQIESPSSPLLRLFLVISQNTAVPNHDLSTPFQAPQTVVASDSKALPTNSDYVQKLRDLENAINTMLLTSGAQADPNAAKQVIDTASQADGAVTSLSGSFRPDPDGGMDKSSEDLLRQPIKSVEFLGKGAPAEMANKGGKDLCSQISPVLMKFPFNPDSKTDASSDEVSRLFGPGQGIYQAISGGPLGKLIVLQNNYYVPISGSSVSINPAFLHFLNTTQQLTGLLFPGASSQPQLSFTLRQQQETANLPPATLDIDGTSLTTAGQTKQFLWTSTSNSSIRLNAAGFNIRADGPWSVFHFAYGFARHPSTNVLEFVNETNGRTATSDTGAPLDYKYEVGGAAAQLLDPNFMRRGLRCISKVAAQ